MIQVDSQFDGGNISLVNTIEDDLISLRINKDCQSEFLQWFYFSISGLQGKPMRLRIENAGQTTYPKGWENYNVVMSSDRRNWIRTQTHFDGQQLEWSTSGQDDRNWFAYFAPYTLDQHADLITNSCQCAGVRYQCLGTTSLGRSIDYLHIGDTDSTRDVDIMNSDSKSQLWIIARQHPGEPMAEWWVQGWLNRLLDRDDATSVALRTIADIHVVPNMNPDGTYLGHLRTNSLGINLNREWANPSAERSPEVFHVKRRMMSTGVDLALDVHGDEALPYNFIAGTEGIDGWTEDRDRQLLALKHTWASLNPDFQYRHGYPRTPAGKANPGICSNQLASTFGCLAMTLEMPFKDTADTPRVDQGWSPGRSQRLGASFVDVAYLTLTNNLMIPEN